MNPLNASCPICSAAIARSHNSWYEDNKFFCTQACAQIAKEKRRNCMPVNEPTQQSLDFPPVVTNKPTETFKATVDQTSNILTIFQQMYSWFSHSLQTKYNRVEWKWDNYYFVIAKLKEEKK